MRKYVISVLFLLCGLSGYAATLGGGGYDSYTRLQADALFARDSEAVLTNRAAGQIIIGTTNSNTTLTWNGDEDTQALEFTHPDGGTVTINGETYQMWKNADDVAITNGQPVVLTGGTGRVGRIMLADADDNDRNSVVGIYTGTNVLAPDAIGRITRFGKVRGFDLASLTIEGVVLEDSEVFLSTERGKYTTNAPSAPVEIIKIGECDYAQTNSSTYDLVVAIQNLKPWTALDDRFVQPGDSVTLYSEAGSPTTSQLVSKAYVDEAVGGATLEYYLYGSEASDIAGYYKALQSPSSAITATNVYVGVTNNQYIGNYITEPDKPAIVLLREGIYSAHGHFRWTARSNPLALATITPELYIYDSNGVFKAEIETGSAEALNFQSDTEVDAHFTLSSDIMILATDRIGLRWKVGGISTYTVSISVYTEGTTAARFEIETNLSNFPTRTEFENFTTQIGRVRGIETESTTNLVLNLTDAGQYIRLTNAVSCAINLPANATVNWAGEAYPPVIYFRVATDAPPTFSGGLTVGSGIDDPKGVITALENGDNFALQWTGTNTWDCL